MRIRPLTWFRLSVLSRALVLGGMILGALWPTYLNLHYAYNNPRIVGLSHGTAWEYFYRIVQYVDSWFGAENTLSSLFLGTPSSMTLFGISFTDPVVAISVLLGNPTAFGAVIFSLCAVLIVAAVFGRGYCAFGCPASLFFTAMSRLREKIESFFPSIVKLRRRLPDGLRWGILIGGTVSATLFGVWIWNLLLPYQMLSTQLMNLVLGVPFGLSMSVVVFVFTAELLVFPGEFCRAACPLGLLLGRMSTVSLFKIRADKTNCPEGCDSCLATCDLSLDPSDGAVPDCNLCGRCVAVCPSKRLSIGAGLPAKKARVFIAVAAFLLLFIAPASSSAHHYHGLPHYGYFDNYPQTPTEEYISGDGRWEMNFTLYNFQGMRREDVNQPDDVQIFLVVFDLKEKTTYGGHATIEIFSGDDRVAVWSQEAEQESIFLVSTKIPDPDDLSLKVAFNDHSGTPVTLSSEFQLPGEGGHRPLVWVGFGLLFLVIMLVFAGKQSRRVRKPKGSTK